MIKMVSLGLIALTFLFSINLTLQYETTTLKLGVEHFDKIEGSKTKFFSVPLDSNLADNDLLIDAKIQNRKNEFFEAPLVLVSTNSLPNTDKNSKWVCNQLGSETCFITNKHLKNSKEIFIAVFCNDCDFSVSAIYVKDEILKDGVSNLFHLKAGDTKVFKLNESFTRERNWIQVTSFNLKMTPYQMNLKIQERANSSNFFEVPVKTNWIGGQQALLKPKSDAHDNSNFDYFVTIKAEKDGVFNLEARSSNGLIALQDRSIKFENIKENQKLCFSYNIDQNNSESDVQIHASSVRGEVVLNVFPQNSEQSSTSLTISSGTELNHRLSADFRANKDSASGVWLICAEAKEKEAFLTLQVYLDKNSKVVEKYKKLLYSLLKKDEMYDIEDVHQFDTFNNAKDSPAFRMLLQTDEIKPEDNTSNNSSNEDPSFYGTNDKIFENTGNNSTDTNKNTTGTGSYAANQSDDKILINGMGVAGIGVSFLFLISVLIGCFTMMGIFVNTKFIEQPIKIKITE